MSLDRAVAAVLLDVGGVLFVPDHEVYGPVLQAAAVVADPDLLDRGHYAGIAAMEGAGEPQWEAYFRAVAQTLGSAAIAADLEASWDRPGIWTRMLPGTVEGLAQLAGTGVGLGIVSNSDGTVAASLRSAGICQVGPGPGVEMGVIVDSHLAGVEKPDPRIFDIALRALGVSPAQAVHVGDTIFADVRGAEAAGVLPIHFDPYALCADRLGHLHAASLSEVAGLVRG